MENNLKQLQADDYQVTNKGGEKRGYLGHRPKENGYVGKGAQTETGKGRSKKEW